MSEIVLAYRAAPPWLAVVHAGHYSLSPVTAEQDLLPPEAAAHASGFDFARLTLESACLAVKALATRGLGANALKLMILVNDWQDAAPPLDDRRLAERAAAALRTRYYREVPRLPRVHNELLTKHGLDPDLWIFKDTTERWLFSESLLRNEAVKLLATTAAEGRSPHLTAESGVAGNTVVNFSNGEQQTCLVFSGTTNCTGEMIALLLDLYRRGVRLFVNIFPSLCWGPVCTATEVGLDLFELDGMRVVNIGLECDESFRLGHGDVMGSVAEYGSDAPSMKDRR